MAHAQHGELLAKIRQFLTVADATLIVHEPDSRRELNFSYAAEKGGLTPVMRLVLPNYTDEQLRGAARVGLPAPKRYEHSLQFGPRRGTSMPIAQYVAPVRSADDAAKTCLAIFREVFGVEDDVWLWMTALEQRDDWPVPLPKPNDWPPP